MRLSRRHLVPDDLALLYEFVNSLDLRRFVQHGLPHAPADELSTVAGLELWMRRRGLLAEGVRLDREDHRIALALRASLRALLQLEPADRHGDAAALVNESAASFPLIVQVCRDGEVRLEPQPRGPSSGLGGILAELQHAAEAAQLDRLKTCASDECRWVFYDRSKPGTRRWCASTLCGNRQKTRAYRRRQREGAVSRT